MSSTVAHIDNQQIGSECQQLDLDSMSHLKRYTSLNLGNDSLLHRELSVLITQPHESKNKLLYAIEASYSLN